MEYHLMNYNVIIEVQRINEKNELNPKKIEEAIRLFR
jgi:hypothetical protein